MHAVFLFICARKCATFFNDEKRHWDSYQLFLDVSRSGGLTGAASLTGFKPRDHRSADVELEERIGKACSSAA